MKAQAIAQINKIEDDIKSITIQGATNVALATLLGMRVLAQNYEGEEDAFRKDVEKIGTGLADARENEPLARNAVRYVLKELETNDSTYVQSLSKTVIQACDAYESIIHTAKEEMIKFGAEVLKKEDVILTHCHSSSATSILKNVVKLREIEGKETKVISTETRPLYQGRKTAKDLSKAGINVTQIVDSAAASFIIEDSYEKVGAVVVGCDELLKDGSFINKVGTYSIALSATIDKDEFYVATTLLKLDPARKVKKAEIEQREAKEVWKDAPKGLRIINPAFDHVKADFVTGYITEAGVLEKKDIVPSAKKMYPWIF
jgi:ribose 1,5-bisphosphate isomerase